MKAILKNNGVYKLEGTQMEVEVILASYPHGTTAPPIYTIRMRYPRIIHAEVMTHRVFSRNARSSRAVPVSRMIEEIRQDPFIPWHWGKNQKGMQASEECNEPVTLTTFEPGPLTKQGPSTYFKETHERRRNIPWLIAASQAADIAEAYAKAGYHKQICNRLLEPFMYIDVLVTSTDWENFFWLRNHTDAEPHLQDLARLVEVAMVAPEMQTLEPNQWHLPYITPEDWEGVLGLIPVEPGARATTFQVYPLLCKLSAARCARISYAPFDGNASYEKELERYESLISSKRIHASPLEHQATPDTLSYTAIQEAPKEVGFKHDYDSRRLHGNFRGWIQYRKTVPGEAVW